MAESSGVPVPGETGLIAAGVLASKAVQIEARDPDRRRRGDRWRQHRLCDRARGGRWLLERPGRWHSQRLQALQNGEVFFERHGPKAVFFGRFLLGLRVWASWLAGATHMHWRSFAFWNACGGICWATAIGLLAYFVGHAAGNAIQTFGLFGLAAVLLAVGLAFTAHRRHQRRRGRGNVRVPAAPRASARRSRPPRHRHGERRSRRRAQRARAHHGLQTSRPPPSAPAPSRIASGRGARSRASDAAARTCASPPSRSARSL